MSSNYALGFFFDQRLENVVLISKQKPSWQRGFLNGVGGKIEPGETSLQAMVREFEEETGVKTHSDDWSSIASLQETNGWSVDVFATVAFDEDFWSVRTTTDEEIVVVLARFLDARSDVLPNLRWLIPLCLDFFRIGSNLSKIEAYYQADSGRP